MRPRRINEGASFGPEVLKVVSQAFDEAWEAVAGKFTPDEYNHVRDDLAEAIMATVREDTDDVQRLRDAGIRALQMKYPSRFGGLPQAEQERETTQEKKAP